jgi:hypothetical protein
MHTASHHKCFGGLVFPLPFDVRWQAHSYGFSVNHATATSALAKHVWSSQALQWEGQVAGSNCGCGGVVAGDDVTSAGGRVLVAGRLGIQCPWFYSFYSC